MHKYIPGPDSGASPLTIRRELDQISRFSPNLLIRQLLEEAVLHQKNHQEVLPCQPSLRKFHGAVLFVDISGFTQLSQKLDVDNLRKFINAYFKKLIDIVHKYSGEIIKFAGDAMYIVWQTPAPPTDIDERILKLMLENACSCAQEIIRVCSNYKVDLRQSVRGDQKPQISGTRLQVKQMTSFIPSLYLSGRHGSENGRAPDAQFAYLNVHCGLSFGWMAGIDVGYDHRWEYFIVGEPLTDVAAAESCASKGEIGLSDAVHCIIHDDGLCMCARQDDACWILQSPSSSTKLSSKLGPASLTIDTVAQSHDVHVLQHVGELQDSICRAVQVHSDNQNQSTTDASEFLRFQQVLYEHLMLHTHEVIRNMMSTKSTVLPTSRQTSPRTQSSLPSPSVSSMRRGELDGRRTPVFVRRLRQMTTVDQHPAASETRNIDVADQRDVVTVFVNIEWAGNMAVAPVDVSTCGLTPYHFVVETDRNKLDHDQRVLQAYQSCFRIVIQCFHKAGGQIRQFIVDDKGTVAICTFGLRGSVSKEAATDAVEASLRLIEMLNLELNASASVGITSGKAYNGLVGSSERHEFAVMGPSVNMSARLMGKAPKNGVLCDETVRHSDKFHQFVHFADVVAKGYDAPVATFAPVTTDRSASMYLSKIATQVESNHQNKLDDDGSTDDLVFIGRKQELANICVFLQQMSGNDEAWWHILLGGRGIDRPLRPPTMVHRETNENNHENESDIPVYSFAHCLDSVQSRLLVVEGSHGIGKTHLLQSISQRIAKYLDQTGFAATLAIHCIPQIKLKQSEPFSSMKPLLDTLLNRYMDWTAKRSFDPLAVTELSRRSRMKTLRSLAMLVDKMPFEVQVLQPLLGLINKSYAADDNDTTRALSPPDRLQQLGHFLFVLLQTFQQAIGRVLFLNIDDLYVMDRSTQGLLKQLLEKGKGFVVMTAASFETVESEEYLAIHALKAAVSEPQRVCTVQLDVFTMREIQSFVRVMGHKMVTTLVPLFASSSSVSSGGGSSGDDDTVVERTMALVQQVDIQQISDLTGGVPLYLRELVQEIVHQALRPANQGNVTGSSVDNSSGRVLMSSHTWFKRVKRVEEVIAMRFDQLDRKMQLLMKVVAVACAFGADASPVMVTRMMMEYVTDACAVFNCAKNSERSLLTKIGELMETLSSSNTFLMKTSRVSNNNSESIDYDPGAGSGATVGGGGGDTTTGMATSPPHMHASLSSPTSSGKKNVRAVLLPENTSYFDLMRLATRSASTLNSSPSTVRQPSTVSSAAGANHVVNHAGPMSPTTPGSTWGATEDSALQEARYNFRIDLEQEVIYGMLLQEQKVLLHLHAAVHYQQCEEAQQVLPMSCTHDQALHWEAAQEYQRALSCFFRAATTLLHSGAVPEAMHYLELAYQMFYAMKQTVTKELFASTAGAPSQEISTGANTRGPATAATAATPVAMTTGMPTGSSPGIAIDRRFSVSFDDHSWPAMHTPATMPVVMVDDEDSAYEAMIQYYSMENVQRLLMAFAGQCKVTVPAHCPTIDPSLLLWNRVKCADLFGNDRVLLEECIASISYLVCLKAQRDVDPETLWYLCAEALELLFVNARSTASLPASPRWELSSSSSSSKSFASRMMGLSDRRELSGSAARTPEGLTLLSLPSQGASRMDVAAETIREPLDPELPSSSTFGIDRSDALCLHVIYHVMQTVARLAAAAALQATTSSSRTSHPPLTAALPLSPAAVRDMQTVSAQLMVSMARTLALTRPELCFHVPVALSHQLTLLLPEMALSDTAVPLLAEILATYDYSSMHVAIGDFYGEDLVLSTLVDCWKLAYVSGDMFHLEKLWNCLINIDLENTLHTASMIWTGWNVALALVLMQRVEEAYLCFSKLLLVMDQHPDFHGIYDDISSAGNGAGGSGGGDVAGMVNGRNSGGGSGSSGGSNGRGGSGSACHRNLVEYYAIICAMQVRNKFVTGAYQTSDTHLSPLLFELPADFDITNIERTVHFLASRVGLWDKLQAGDFSAVCWSTPPSPTAAADGTSPATNSPGVGSPELTPTGPDATTTTTNAAAAAAAAVPRPSLAHVAWTMRMERMGCSAEALFAWACTLQAEYLLVKLTQDTDTVAAPAIREQAVQIGLHLSLAATYLHAAETAVRISNGVETLLDCSQLNGERLFLQQVAQDRAALLQRLQRLLPVGLGMGVPMNGESPNGGGSHGGGLAVDVDMHWPLSPLVAPSPTFTHHPAAPTSTPLPTPTSSTFGLSMRPTVATSATPSSTSGGGTVPFRALGAQLARLRLLQAAQVALDPPPSPCGPSIPLGRSRPDWTTAQIPVVIRAMQVHYATMAKRTATPRREADAVLFAKFPLLLQKYYSISSSSLDHSHSHSGLATVNM